MTSAAWAAWSCVVTPACSRSSHPLRARLTAVPGPQSTSTAASSCRSRYPELRPPALDRMSIFTLAWPSRGGFGSAGAQQRLSHWQALAAGGEQHDVEIDVDGLGDEGHHHPSAGLADRRGSAVGADEQQDQGQVDEAEQEREGRWHAQCR